MEENYLRLLCAVNNSRGINTSVQEPTSSICSSNKFVSYTRPSQVSTSISRSGHYVTKSCNRGGVDLNSVSGILFPSFSGSKEDWRNEASHRPIYSEQISYCSPLQNGNKQIHQGFNPSRNVDYFSGSFRRVFPHSHFQNLQEIPSLRLEQQSFPVQGSPFWPVYSPFGFYQNHAGSYSSPTFPVYSDSFLSGRFPSQGILPNQIEGSDRFGHQLFSVPRLPYLLEKVRDNSVSRLCFPGRTFPNQCRPSPPTRGEIYKTMSENTFIPDGSISHSTSILATSGSIELSGRCNSIGTTSHSSASVLSAQVMDCSFTRMGSIDSNHSAFISTPSMVVSTGKCNEGPMSVPSSSQSNIIHRCLHPRLGSISGGAYNLGSLESRSFGRAYQCIGNESSSVCTESFPNVSKESVCHSGHGQHNSCSLSQESGRNSFTFSLSDSQRHSPSVFSTPGSSSGETYCGAPQYSSRHSIQIPCSSKHGVGTTSSSFQSCDSSLGVTSDRSVCDQSQSQTSNICVSGSRSKIFCSRRNEPILERNVRVRLPSFQVSLPSTSENSRGKLQDHSYCSSMAKTVLVSRPSAPIMCLSSSSTSETRPSVSNQGQGSLSKSRKTSSTRLASLRVSLRKRGFSEGATKHLTKSVRDSTSIVYDAKWSIFSDWCSEREIDPFQVTVQQLADFLVFLFESKGLCPSTIKGYRSAISRTIHISGGPDFGINEHISLLVRSFSLERPRQKTLVPKWDLGLVLSFLKLPPFEPAETIDLRFLSYKCCFLLALASGRRRSEIHAFSISDACLRFNRDKSSVTLLTDPAFLAKNQIPDKGAEPVVIPALPSDSISVLLCPVRILSIYLERTCSLRSVSNSRLFIPIKKGISDLSVKTISTWICKCISLAYGSSKAELLNSFNVKAHDVRGISTSWALFNSASLEEVLSAGFWRNENSFISHYLQSMATFAESLYSLGPIVSAQRLNFPPVSSVTGDSALR